MLARNALMTSVRVRPLRRSILSSLNHSSAGAKCVARNSIHFRLERSRQFWFGVAVWYGNRVCCPKRMQLALKISPTFQQLRDAKSLSNRRGFDHLYLLRRTWLSPCLLLYSLWLNKCCREFSGTFHRSCVTCNWYFLGSSGNSCAFVWSQLLNPYPAISQTIKLTWMLFLCSLSCLAPDDATLSRLELWTNSLLTLLGQTQLDWGSEFV